MTMSGISSAVYKALYTSRNHVQPSEYCSIISSEDLKALLKSQAGDFLLIDSRTPVEYSESHIPGAVNIPEKRLNAYQGMLPSDKDMRLIFYCNGMRCGKSARSGRTAVGLGFRNVAVFAEGMPVWEEKGCPFYKGPGYLKQVETRKISPHELKDLMAAGPDDVTVVDVCDREEYAEEHIPGSINLPLSSFASGSGILDRENKIIVYCKSGGRSRSAFRKLMALDYKNIYQLVLDDWKASGMPVEHSASRGPAAELNEDVLSAGQSGEGLHKVVVSVGINAPVEKVFDFVASPHNWQRYITGLKNIAYAAAKPPASGTIFTWTYNIRGIDVQGSGQVVELARNRKLVLQMHTLLPIRKTIYFEGGQDRTVLKAAVGYDSPGKVMSFLFRLITKRINRKESSVILERIKAFCEEEQTGRG